MARSTPTPADPPAGTLQLVELDITTIAGDPNNVRRQVGDIDGLTASISAQGVLQPIKVIPIAKPGRSKVRWRVLYGHRRLAAAIKAGLTTIPALLSDPLDALAALEEQLVENVEREDLSPLEEADAFARLVDLGATQRRIAELVGISQAHVAKRLSLRKLTAEDQAAVHAGQLAIGLAIDLARLGGHPAAYKRARRNFRDHADQRHLHQIIQQEVDEIDWAPARDTAAAALKAQGTKVVAWPTYWYRAGCKPLADSKALAGRKLGHNSSDTIEAHLFADFDGIECGHVGATVSPNGTVVIVCTNPDAHQAKKRREAPNADIARHEAAEKAKAAAHRARRKAVTTAFSGDDPIAPFRRLVGRLTATQGQIIELLATSIISGNSPAPAAKVLGITPVVEGSYLYKDWIGGIYRWADDQTSPDERLARLLTAAVTQRAWQTADSMQNGDSHPHHRALTQLLASLGQEPAELREASGL